MPDLELEPWEVMLILRLRAMRKQGERAALVHLDSEPAVRGVGRREKLIDIQPENEYHKTNRIEP
jgi:hypothetical protein